MFVGAFDEQGDIKNYVHLGIVLVCVNDLKDTIVWVEKKLREKLDPTDLEWAGNEEPLPFWGGHLSGVEWGFPCNAEGLYQGADQATWIGSQRWSEHPDGGL